MFTNSCQDLALDAETPIMVRSLCPQFVDTALVKDSMEALPSEVAAGIMASTGGELLTPELVGRECMKLVTTSKTESNTLFVSNGDLGTVWWPPRKKRANNGTRAAQSGPLRTMSRASRL